MFETAAIEFPFVERLPKREKSRLQKAWDLFQEAKAAQDKHGFLVPERLAAKVAGVSQQRISQLRQAGVLLTVDIDEHPFITEDSLVEWMKSERKRGRPPKVQTASECWQAAREFASENKSK